MEIPSPRARPKGLLSLNMDLINQPQVVSYDLDSTVYRQDGLSIGRDFLRFESETISRNEFCATSLDVLETIGRGAFSTVCKAQWNQEKSSQPYFVAIKDCSLLTTSRERRHMLVRELQLLCQLPDSPYLVALYSAFLQTDSVSLVLEYMDGGSLDQLMHEGGVALPQPAVCGIVYQMLHGVAVLHRRRILHRDLKTGNVLYNARGVVKLCDFGLGSMLTENSLTRTVLGTAKYMSPERLRAQPYGRPSDLWSLGLVLVSLLTGQPPWNQVESMVELLVTMEEMDLNDLWPSETCQLLQEILVGCLQIDAAKRIPAHVLVQSPHFASAHIATADDAVSLVREFLR